jgi:hypothetical protein
MQGQVRCPPRECREVIGAIGASGAPRSVLDEACESGLGEDTGSPKVDGSLLRHLKVGESCPAFSLSRPIEDSDPEQPGSTVSD